MNLYRLTPVTTPPEKEGWYVTLSGEAAAQHYFNGKTWKYAPHLPMQKIQFDSYLSELPDSTIAISEEKLREVIRRAILAAKMPTTDPDKWMEQIITNEIKALRDE